MAAGANPKDAVSFVSKVCRHTAPHCTARTSYQPRRAALAWSLSAAAVSGAAAASATPLIFHPPPGPACAACAPMPPCTAPTVAAAGVPAAPSSAGGV